MDHWVTSLKHRFQWKQFFELFISQTNELLQQFSYFNLNHFFFHTTTNCVLVGQLI